MDELIIRPCTREDLRALEWDGAYRDDRILIDTVFKRASAGAMGMLVAEIGGTLVGQIWIDFARKPGIAILWALRVVPSWRRHGIGTLLIDAAERSARRAGARATELGIEDDNSRARSLYEGLGYRRVGREIAVDSVTGEPLGFELDVLRRSIPAAKVTAQAEANARRTTGGHGRSRAKRT